VELIVSPALQNYSQCSFSMSNLACQLPWLINDRISLCVAKLLGEGRWWLLKRPYLAFDCGRGM
jgi:hypothetical protein